VNRGRAWHWLLTALVKGITRAISKTIWAGDLLEACEHAKILHPWQKRQIWERLVRGDFPPVGCQAGLAEDGRVSQLPAAGPEAAGCTPAGCPAG
jgi:hypothetical protein